MRILNRIMFLIFFFASTPIFAEEVDLELVLVMDASGSISRAEYLLQLEGAAATFESSEIQAAITSGPTGKVAVTVMLWSDAAFPKFNSGWYLLDGPASSFADSS